MGCACLEIWALIRCVRRRAGKTTLLNALVTMYKRSDEVLAVAFASLPEPRYELSDNDVGAAAEEAEEAAAALTYAELPEGAELTREGFEAFMQAQPAHVSVLKKTTSDADRRARRSGDSQSTLPFRGPFVSLHEINAEASTFTPMHVDQSPDDYWHVDIRFRSELFIARCVQAAAAAAAGAAAAPLGDEEEDGVDPAGENALFYPALGRDLLGFNGSREPPERLAHLAPADWTVSPWLKLFAGRTLRFTVAAPTWVLGCAAVHDHLLMYTRNADGLWAAIDTNGLRVLAPADMPSPLADLQGARVDETSRDMEVARALRRMTPHAYIFIVHNEFPPGLWDLTCDRVVAALNGEAASRAMGAAAALEEAAPPTVMAVTVVDKYADADFTSADLLDHTTDVTSKEADDVRRKLRNTFEAKFRAVPTDQFDAIKCHAITPTRVCAFGMKTFADDLDISFKRAQHAEYRRVVHSMLRNATTALGLLDTMKKATADAGAAATSPVEAAKVHAATLSLAAEKARLITMCTTIDAATNVSELEQEVEAVLLERMARRLYDVLLEGLNTAASADFDVLAELERLGIGPVAMKDQTVAQRCETQLTHLRTCSRDSKVLTALLRPALDELARFSSTTLALMAHGPRVTEEVSTWMLDRLFHGHPLAALLPRRSMNPADPNDKVLLQQWLFVQRLRLNIVREVGIMQSSLAAMCLADLREAVFRCGCAEEHYQKVIKTVLKQGSRTKTQEAYDLRYATLAHADVGPAMLKDVCAALAEYVGTYFYNFMYASAERIKDAFMQACTEKVPSGATFTLGGYESEAEEGGVDKILRAAMLESAADEGSGAGSSSEAAKAASIESTIRAVSEVVNELTTLLTMHCVKYDTTLVTNGLGEVQPVVNSTADAILRRVITRHGAKRAREQQESRYKELETMSVAALQAHAHQLGLGPPGTKGLKRRADLMRRIAEKEHLQGVNDGAPAARLARL